MSIRAVGNIQNIIFDLGGVIINLDNKLTEKALLDLGAKDFSNISDMVLQLPFSAIMKWGKFTDQQFIA